jgi:hypothetical protein
MHVCDVCDTQGRDHLSYSCRCSFLEIYNESIRDLLNPAASNLHIREALGRGCFVEGLSETEIENGALHWHSQPLAFEASFEPGC